MKKSNDVLNLIGNTPLISIRNENIIAKAEFLNPGGSIKDRVALAMIEGAERDGTLKPGMTIVEPTSGNTGIGITLIGVAKGYKVNIVMPKGMSEERKKIIKIFGGNLICGFVNSMQKGRYSGIIPLVSLIALIKHILGYKLKMATC